MKTSIHLRSNELTFFFPTLKLELEALVNVHVEQALPAFLAEFASTAEQKLVRNSTWKTFCPKVLDLSNDQIASAYRNACLGKLPSEVQCDLSFQRTLRLPDDGKTYPLPAGLGRFPLRSVTSCADSAPASWLEKGGAILPMYQGEAMWMSFRSTIPCAVKIVSGSVNALTGELDREELGAEPQNYVVLPDQPWLDGFKVAAGTVRQFVAMPLGGGFSVSEQLARNADAGGVVIEVFPMKAGRYFAEALKPKLANVIEIVLTELLGPGWKQELGVLYCRSMCAPAPCYEDMGLGAGGKIRQEVYKDEYGIDSWDFKKSTRVCVHTCNAMMWRAVTGENPPHPPLTAKEYARYRIPWFDFYRDDLTALAETKELAGAKSIGEVAMEKGLAVEYPDEEIIPSLIVQYGNTRRPEEIQAWGRL